MTEAEKVFTVLDLIDEKLKVRNLNEPVVISCMRLGRSGVSTDDARDILSYLSTDEGLKCIKIAKYPDLFAKLENRTADDVYHVEPLPNFYDVLQKYHERYLWSTDLEKARRLYPRDDLDLSIRDFVDDYGRAGVLVGVFLNMHGSDVILHSADGTWVLLHKFRSGMPAYNFIEYLMAHPDISIKKENIRKLEGCQDVEDLTEFVRNIGFNKLLKKYFFPGTTKDRVYFKPETELPRYIVESLRNRRSSSLK